MISSWQAWPDTWVSWEITFAPFMESSLMTLATAFSFPGMGVELKITTSHGVMDTFRCREEAILDKAAMDSPWLPVVMSTVSSSL